MSKTRKTDSLLKFGLALILAASLSACQGSNNSSPSTNSAVSAYEVPGDHAIGNVDAPITVVEYASVVCGACANWHMTVYPDFKKKYIDTGEVRYVFREFPTAPESMARAGFLIANCAGEDKFLDNISMQFKRQQAILSSPTPRDTYMNLAKASGMSEQEFDACMVSEEENDRYEKVVKGGIEAGVAATPAFFINGKQTKVFTIEDFDKTFAETLGQPLPEETPPEETSTEDAASATSSEAPSEAAQTKPAGADH